MKHLWLSILMVSACIAGLNSPAWPQTTALDIDVEHRSISLTAQQANLERILNELARKTDIVFYYPVDLKTAMKNCLRKKNESWPLSVPTARPANKPHAESDPMKKASKI